MHNNHTSYNTRISTNTSINTVGQSKSHCQTHLLPHQQRHLRTQHPTSPPRVNDSDITYAHTYKVV